MKGKMHEKRHLIRSFLIIAIATVVGSAVLGPYGTAAGFLAGVMWVMWQRRHHHAATA